MTQFSSRPPFNDDPLPWTDPRGENRHGPYGGWSSEYAPRPEFDRPQHNPTNPILTEFRKCAAEHGDAPRLAAHWTKSDWMWAEMCLKDHSFVDEPIGTPEQERHARRVLTRLANLADKEPA